MKKLSGWARSRSRRRGSQAERTSTPDGKAVSSKSAAPPVPEIPREYRTSNQIDNSYIRPGSSNKMKPMLIGVSRPSQTMSRPGTSDSLQNAVSQAADKVVQTVTSNVSQKQGSAVPQSSRAGPTKSKAPRYIDLASITNPKTALASYNEDIAARNLDTVLVAKTDAGDGYIPTSKYQEEVATRNTPAPLRPSMDSARLNSLEGYRPNNAELRGRFAPREHENQIGLANDINIRRFPEVEKASQYQYNQRRELLGHAGPPTRASLEQSRGHQHETSQGRSVHNMLPNDRPLHTQTHIGAQNIENQDSFANNSIAQPSAAQLSRRQRNARPAASTQASQASDLPMSSLSRTDSAPSTARPPLPETDGYGMSGTHGRDHSQSWERPQSPMSTTSSVRRNLDLPNRRVMDLTGDDSEIFSDGSPVSYASKSPIVEHARMNTFSKMQPNVVTAAAGAGLHQKGRDHQDLPDNVTIPSATVSGGIRQYENLSRDQSPSTFSTINTIASLPPQGRHAIQKTPMPPLNQAPPKEVRRPASSNLYTVAETEPDQIYDEDLSRSSHRLSSNLQGPFDPYVPQTMATPPVSRHDFVKGQEGLEQRQTIPPSPASSLRTPTQSDYNRGTPNGIQQSPESLHSSDFINPGGSFGVRTRDFAVTPQKFAPNPAPLQPVSVNKISKEPDISVRMQSPDKSKQFNIRPKTHAAPRSKSADAEATKYSPEFNEEGYRAKQEKIREALIKLQESLDEDFVDPLPPRARSKPGSSRDHASSGASSSDGRPYAPPPTSIFGQIKDTQRPATSQANGIREPRETSRPRTSLSVHEQVTKPRSASPASTSTMKPIRRRKSPILEVDEPEPLPLPSRKGKERELSNGLVEMQRLADEMRTTKLVMPTPAQQRLYQESASPIPRSPGEISLSSFPVPTPSHSRQASLMSNGGSYHHQIANTVGSSRSAAAPSPVISPSPDIGHRRPLNRRNSAQSQASAMTSASQHSIPYHLIPERGSSMRDAMVLEDESEI